ncbi:Iron-sulfur cluster-binding protein [hydrothermal vent metagenome]|uniref:Iron-sulfur cluster-binding protein n=1 Tax=hydrothermal vent metagenome TaxID=652676 RepID=A0A3B1BYA2_9ZZZZ
MTYKSGKEDITRRQFINKLAIGGGAALGAAAVTYFAHSDKPVYRQPEKIFTLPDFGAEISKVYPRIVITHGTRPLAMVRAAVDRMGGIEKFIQPGDRVVIKPNVAWDRLPEQAANTNPDVVAAVVTIVKEARAGQIIVTDVSLNDPERCFARSGIEEAASIAGGKIWIPAATDFKLADLKGELLNVWPVSRAFLEADKVINLPVVKHHSLSQCTLAQKNWYGILGGRRNRLHQDIHTSIADLSQAMLPTLTILDGTRALMRNGPTGGNPGDVETHNIIIAGLDEVAIDSYGMGILGIDPNDVKYMALAQKRGLGRIDWKSVSHYEINV